MEFYDTASRNRSACDFCGLHHLAITTSGIILTLSQEGKACVTMMDVDSAVRLANDLKKAVRYRNKICLFSNYNKPVKTNNSHAL